MRVLLDNNLNWRLAKSIERHAVDHVQSLGWDRLRNGELLQRAESQGFDALVTADKGFQHQQNLTGRRISVLVLRTRSLALPDLLRGVPVLQAALDSL